MPLTLTITSYQRLSPAQEVTKRVDQGSITIGRGSGNDWVLPDPEQVLSKKHCTIEYRDNGYFLTDTSTNGIFINQSPQRVGRGQSIKLNDGDELTLGEYEILVSITPAPGHDGRAMSTGQTDRYAPPLSTDFSQPHARSELPFDDPFADLAAPAKSTPSTLDILIPEDSDLLKVDWAKPSIPEPASEPDNLPAERVFFQPPEPVRVAPAAPSEDVLPSNWDMEPVEPIATAMPSTAPVAIPKPEPKAHPVQAPANPPPPLPSTTGRERAILAAFLAGAGLPPVPIADEDILPLMTNLGEIFRETVQGLMQVLIARSRIKSEFRLAQTTLQPAANNPLKFSLSVDDAMINLLTKQGPAYLSAVQALREAFNDIKAHQLAVMTGTQAALSHLLRRFDPQILEARLGNHSMLDSLLPSNRKARYWNLFNALYAEIAKEAEDDFQELFGREFARAYEEQVRKL